MRMRTVTSRSDPHEAVARLLATSKPTNDFGLGSHHDPFGTAPGNGGPEPGNKTKHKMRITSVKLQNFKGITAEHRLEPVTIITGDNCSGKTAVAMAIKLGLAGALPVIGKSPQSIYRLAGNPDEAGEMGVTLVTDPPGVIQHRWTRTAKGTVSHDGSLPPDLAWPEAMLDFRRFLSLPGADQAAEIFARCKTDAKPDDFLHTLDTVTGGLPAVVRQVVQEVRDHCTAPLPLAEWIAKSLDWVKKQTTQAATDEKQAGAALQVHMRNQPARAEDVSAKLAEAEREMVTWAVSAEAWKLSKKTMDEAFEASMRDLRERLDQAKRMDCCPTCGANVEGWSSKMQDEINGKMESLRKDFERREKEHTARKPDETPKAAQARIVELQDRVNELRSKQTLFHIAMGWRKRGDTLELETAMATGRLDAYKQIGKRLMEWRDQQINAGIGDILAVANRFADGLLFSPLEWHQERAEFGRRGDGGGWISLDGFSGFEEQLAFAALSVAVASQTKIKVVIMDELGRLKPSRKALVVRRMFDLIRQGVIGQFVGIDVDAADYRGFDGNAEFRIITL